MIQWIFALGGAAAGTAQAGLLARTARRGHRPLPLLARLLLVGAVLFAAARAGHLASATAGWLVGFVAAGLVLHGRLR